jgi:hypothetical protein
LNWKVGIDLGAAREKVRVAHALTKLPQVAAAMARGALSYSKVRALTRVACEQTEAYFLEIALHGTASHVEKLVRGYRRAKEAEELSREGARRADALGRIAESFLQHGVQDLSSGDRQQIVIHVDAETLRDSVAGRCELEDGPPLAH